jgi:hypothetical protein
MDKKVALYSYRKENPDLEECAKMHGYDDFEYYIELSPRLFTLQQSVQIRQIIQNCIDDKIQALIVADLSVFGVNYCEIGAFLGNFLPLCGVRFISLLENIDTNRNDTEYNFIPENFHLGPFYLEIYPSKLHSKISEYTRKEPQMRKSSPYGYVFDVKDGRKLTSDPKSALVVKEIFNTYIKTAEEKPELWKNSQPPVAKVKNYLKNQKIMRPEELKKIQKDPNHELTEESFGWNNITITRILSNLEYLGHTFYSLNRGGVEKNYFFYHTHEALIDVETFRNAQKILNSRNLPTKPKTADPLNGLLFCADCEKEMYPKKGAKMPENKHSYVCGTYKNAPKNCRSHTTPFVKLLEIISEDVKNVVEYVNANREKFSDYVQKSAKIELSELRKEQFKSDFVHSNAEKLAREEINNSWEKYRKEEISDLNFSEMLSRNKTELLNIEKRQFDLAGKISKLEEIDKRLEDFLEITDRYKGVEEFPQDQFSEIIGGIDVHEVTKEPKIVKIDIRYKHIGQVDYEKQKPYFTTFSQRYGTINYQITQKTEEINNGNAN